MNCVARPLDNIGHEAGLYERLVQHATGLPNDDLFARMISGQAAGRSALPVGLGLYPDIYAKLLARHFPAFPPSDLPKARRPEEHRLTERQDLIDLLLEHRAIADPSEVWMAEVVAAACMGGNHLWQDLGLCSRVDLSRLMSNNFPHLTAKNDRDMKWKKFLYRQICEREGVHVCPAPSCQVCADHAKCFGPEE